jgi:pyridinium-3,5-biscarboxylic acid mononucleotide sulfurtransferase
MTTQDGIQTDDSPLLARLEEAIHGRGRIITAFSGGVDSTLVAAVARRVLGKANAPAVIGDSPSLPRYELEQARRIAKDMDLELIEVKPGEQDDAGYRANAGDRCYFCKTHLYESLKRLSHELGICYIANGTNTDDLGDHRPGLTAADEAEVISPLIEAGFGKQQVREVAQELGLENWDKPAAACLASRVPYGSEVTPELLKQIERAEDVLRSLGFEGFRVRHHNQVARIELPLDQVGRLMDDEVRRAVARGVRDAGYLYVALDLEGFRSGSGNLALTVSANSQRGT